MNELGDLLQRLRKSESLNLREAGKKSGLSHTYISDIEKGYRRGKNGTRTPLKPSPDTLKRLADTYNHSYNDLLRKAGYLDDTNNPTESSEVESDLTEEEKAFLNDPYFNRFFREMKDSPEEFKREMLEYIKMRRRLIEEEKRNGEND